jgi:hypothetical protein
MPQPPLNLAEELNRKPAPKKAKGAGKEGENVWVWTHDEAERNLLRLGAAAGGYRSVSAFLLAVGLEAAKKAVEKIKKS